MAPMRQALPQLFRAIIVLAACFNCLQEHGQGTGTDPESLSHETGQTTDAPKPPTAPKSPVRALMAESSFMEPSEPCHHRRDVMKLEKLLEVLRREIVRGHSADVWSLLGKWGAPDTYVHNLDNLTYDGYPQIQCSDLDFLARHKVRFEESIYDHVYQTRYANISYMTVLELALHMTRGANQRALNMAMNRNEVAVGIQDNRIEERVAIIRILLEKGFLWGSGDLVCKVVPFESGYQTIVRQAFARTILHDLVRDSIHLNRTRINFLLQSCGGKGMDGVVWILGEAPGAFSLPGLLSRRTVLMNAAQDDDLNDTFINFPELINLYKVLQAPLTTVDQDGWNAEMHAARALKKEHVNLLKKTTLETWQQEARHGFSILFLGENVSDKLADACVWVAVHVNYLVYIGASFFMCCALFDASLFVSKMYNGRSLDRLLSSLRVFSRCSCTFLCAEMLLRVLWLLTLNTAFLNMPPVITIAWERQVNPFEIPAVSKWNPLPVTVHAIYSLCLVLVAIFGVPDYLYVRSKSEANDSPTPAAPEDRYQDPTCHLLGCICVFGLMTLLMIIYLQIVLRPLEMDPKKIGLWFGSLLVQIKITMDDTLSPEARLDLQRAFDPDAPSNIPGHRDYQPLQNESEAREESSLQDRYQAVRQMMHHWNRWACCMVTPFNTKMWHLLMFSHKRKIHISGGKGPAEGRWCQVEIACRFAMSYISNGLYKAIIVYTLPLWLSRGGLTDFVLNAFATVYIVELDDLANRDEWKLLPDVEFVRLRSKSKQSTTSSTATASTGLTGLTGLTTLESV
ncbi:ALG11 [Symbiodinium natans]|uniref:ALG11 protein n=1 Tax=Symbiodinium natans TaxID=878477 RepID=A0A812Q7S2_9DINO|nr:ALG11 [Symbiodinium natans]